MRTGGRRRHGASRFLCRTTPEVNSKAFLVDAAARSVAPKLLLEKIQDDWFDQAGDNPRHAQEKTGFQQSASGFACAFRSDVDFFLASNDRRHKQTERNRSYDPRPRPSLCSNSSRDRSISCLRSAVGLLPDFLAILDPCLTPPLSRGTSAV